LAWRWASASDIGTSHIQSDDKLQDAYVVSLVKEKYIFALVSDGAGSALYGRNGAWIVSRTFAVLFREWINNNDCLPNENVVADWIDSIRDRIGAIATNRDTTPRQFAATLAVLMVSPSEIITAHIGDSAIVGRRDSEWEVLCWPENGEYASTTYFITDEPEPRLNVARSPMEFDAFALFSDGVGELALSHTENKAHTPFFVPMIRPIDSVETLGHLTDLSRKLKTYLASPAVCERTDDDKTLILISGI